VSIIGVVGLNGSGKDEVVNYLHTRYQLPAISAGDLVREIAAGEGIEPTRDNLDRITRRYFAKYGQGYFLKLVTERIRQNKWQSAGISGIRSPQDVRIVKEELKDDFILVHVYISDPKVRYARMQKRGSQRDSITFEELLKQDQVSQELFQVNEAIRMADYSISNDGTLQDLQSQIDKLVTERKFVS
jgi:dephospho-CoA kinase